MKYLWEALIARFPSHPACGPNSIHTRIKFYEKEFGYFIAWPFSWVLLYIRLQCETCIAEGDC